MLRIWFFQIGKKAEDIGIISPYRSQVKFLQQRVLRDGLPTVEVNTVDQYQGRDKDVIIISFVRSQASDCSKRVSVDMINRIQNNMFQLYAFSFSLILTSAPICIFSTLFFFLIGRKSSHESLLPVPFI